MKFSHGYHYFITVAFLFIFLVSANAQGIIKGKVVDATSRQPLASATINIAGNLKLKATADEWGNFILATLNEQETITISHIGYKTFTVTVDRENIALVQLQPDAVQLDDVNLLAAGAAKFSSLAKIDLAINPVKSTQDLLRIVPGLFIAQHAGGGKAEQIFLRGFNVDHGTDVAVSVDGMPVNMVSHAHGQGYADAHFIIPETINNIDFGAGPYYAQQGNLNTAGYVAFATYKNIAKSLVQTEVGNFSSFRTLTMIDLIKNNKDKQSAYFAGEFNYTNGPTENKQQFNRINLFSKYNIAVNTKSNVTFSASAFKSKWNASGQIPGRAVENGMITRFGSIDPSEGGNTERYNATVIYTHQRNNGGTLQSQLFYNRYKFNLFSNFTFFLNDRVNGDGILQAEQRNIFGWSTTYKDKHFFKNITVTSSGGIGIRNDATSNSRLAYQVKRTVLNNIMLGNINELNAYAYTQQQATFNKWVIDAGVRFDYFYFGYKNKITAAPLPPQRKSIVSPKINVQYNLNKAVQLYAKAGKGFHSNDTRVVVANDGKEILPAAYGADLGIIIKPVKKLLLNIAVWNLYLNQEFVYVGDAGIVEPSGKTKRRGLDIVARYQFAKNLFANANINVTKPRARGQVKGQNYIPLAPTATSIGGVYYKKPTGFNGGINYRYIKNRPANETNTIIAKGYFLVDAAVNYTAKKYEIAFSVENIFNVNWNEAQFATESRLMNEPAAITELHFTPGTPLFAKIKLAVFF